MTFEGVEPVPSGYARAVATVTTCIANSRTCVHITIAGRELILDENHATAFARGIEAAVLEVQARAVSL